MILATSVARFNDGNETDYIFNIDRDDLLNVGPDGKIISSFAPGDDIYYIVNMSSNVSIDEVVVTDGSMRSLGVVERSGSDQKLFTSREEKEKESLSIKHANPTVSYTFIGRRGKVYDKLSAIGEKSFTPELSMTPFLCDFKYSFRAISFVFSAPDVILGKDETYDIGIVFYITVR